MSNATERRVKTLIILLTILWHAVIIYVFFILTRKESYEPLRISVKPQVIEYLLNSLSQQQNNPIPHTPPTIPSALQKLAQAQVQQQLDEDGFEQYMLKNAVSYGSYNQGSVVSMGQEGTGNDTTGQKSEEPQGQPEPAKEELAPEPAQDDSHDKTDNKEQQPTPDKEFSDIQENTVTDNRSGMTPEIARAEEILNNSGSSWIGAAGVKQARRQTQSNAQPVTTSAPKKDVQRKLTMADITRGYIKQVQQEHDVTGHCTYNQGGSSSGPIRYGVNEPPTDAHALSEQIYASKLYNLLEQSAQAYSNQIYSCHDLEMETMIEVTIEKSGKILDVALRPELPEKDMERALCLIVKRVGLFPPIPRQFRKQRIILSIPIRIKSQQGFASYRLLYGLRAA